MASATPGGVQGDEKYDNLGNFIAHLPPGIPKGCAVIASGLPKSSRSTPNHANAVTLSRFAAFGESESWAKAGTIAVVFGVARRQIKDRAMPNWLLPLLALIGLCGFIYLGFWKGLSITPDRNNQDRWDSSGGPPDSHHS